MSHARIPQGIGDLFGAMKNSTAAVEANTAMLEELLRGPPLGVVLLLIVLTILFAWSWHLSRGGSRGGKYRLLGGVGLVAVFVASLGAGSVHVAIVESPSTTQILIDLLVFVPFLLLAALGYGFDRRAVIEAADDDAERAIRARVLCSPRGNALAGFAVAIAVVALGFALRASDTDPRAVQVTILAATLGGLLLLLGFAWTVAARRA